MTPGAPVTYDDRFIQISTNLFNAIAGCTVVDPCFFDFNETTLSAHSFDFVVTGLSAGNYGITVTWTPSTTAAAPNVAKAEAEGVASIQLDGKFIDYPIVYRAQRLLEKIAVIRARERRT